MRILRSYYDGASSESNTAVVTPAVLACRENLDTRRRQETAEVTGVPRCPRCGYELVARMGQQGRPGFTCRCPVRRVLAGAA